MSALDVSKSMAWSLPQVDQISKVADVVIRLIAGDLERRVARHVEGLAFPLSSTRSPFSFDAVRNRRRLP